MKKANGKLLLTGEYLILDGAKSLALPLALGQSMTVKESSGSSLQWKSKNHLGQDWFSCELELYGFEVVKTTDKAKSDYLRELILSCIRINPEFLGKWKKYRVQTELEFAPEWGFGSSSTLTALLAEWADVHPLELHFKTSQGSGYDVACAMSGGPILYNLDGDEICVEEGDFDPNFKDNLYFAYLGKKQNSTKALEQYFSSKRPKKSVIEEISTITAEVMTCKDLESFQKLIKEHEAIIGSCIGEIPIGGSQFKDFDGACKSLGAWGGDFALFASNSPKSVVENYLSNKGINTIFQYKDLVL